MGTKRALIFCRNHCAAPLALGFVFAAGLLLVSALANAQESTAPTQKTPQSEGFFASVSRWFEEQTANVSASFKDARKKVEGFSSAAGDAAKTTVEGGHEKCQLAPNGAPDCVAAANTICKAKGFGSGKSLDMTTAEVCPAKVYMSGRSSGPECTTDTFVSRALCQ
jgi:hypothetical protein